MRLRHVEAAKENYRRTLDALSKAETQNALSEIDRKMREEVRAALQKYE